MKTRRSRKSFEIPPPRKRRNLKRRALNVVNETITLSDSEPEEEVVPLVQATDDEIQVIDVADVTDDTLGKPAPGSCASTSSESESKSQEKIEPPVINLGDDEAEQNEDDDGVEVVAVVVSSGLRSRSKLRRASFNRKSSNGNLQDLIKKVKNRLSRSSSTSSIRNPVIVQNPLNKISANSKRINRKKKNRANNKFRMRIENFQYNDRNALYHNRTRERERQVIFRPGLNQYVNRPLLLNPNNFSFEVNPFLPSNTSTPFSVNDGRAAWMPTKRHGLPRIAPGSNIMNAGEAIPRVSGSLRPIVIDGSNVAVGHGGVLPGGRQRDFSARGIQICVEYFKKRGHSEIVAFVPRYRLKRSECRDPELLEEMERQGHVRFTPSREAGGQRIASYDDLFVVEYAHSNGGIIVSNDQFKDLQIEKPHLKDVIKFRLLGFTWISQDVLMFPEDPLGRNGPSLDVLLRF